ncbi:MAG: hypothetical protein M0038_17030 [Pseudomonadota bacterium]|jgi:hypothetical protein|nr:hypothetical protein [Pseudomonadota bacterium]
MAFMTTASLPGYEVQDLGTDKAFADFIRTASVEELAQERDHMETFAEGFQGVRTYASDVIRERLGGLDEALQLEDCLRCAA